MKRLTKNEEKNSFCISLSSCTLFLIIFSSTFVTKHSLLQFSFQVCCNPFTGAAKHTHTSTFAFFVCAMHSIWFVIPCTLVQYTCHVAECFVNCDIVITFIYSLLFDYFVAFEWCWCVCVWLSFFVSSWPCWFTSENSHVQNYCFSPYNEWIMCLNAMLLPFFSTCIPHHRCHRIFSPLFRSLSFLNV